MAQKKARRKSERRQLPRADARLSMRVEAPVDNQANQLVTESQNISASGVYCSSGHYLAPLSKVSLTIVLPRLQGGKGNELIKCDGIVVRCEQVSGRGEKHYELACMFSGLEPEHRAMIEDFVTWRNLQALRAAAGKISMRGTRKTATAKRAKKTSSRKKKAAVRPKRAVAGARSSAAANKRRKTTSRTRPRAAAAPRGRA